MPKICPEEISDVTIDELNDRRDEIEEFGAYSADLREELALIKEEICKRRPQRQQTNTELNEIIARWMGWEKCIASGWVMPLKKTTAWRVWKKCPPAYASDLNVWNDVWLMIEEYGHEDHFGVELMKVQLNQPPCRTGYYECAKATALQRAEALVKMIGNKDA